MAKILHARGELTDAHLPIFVVADAVVSLHHVAVLEAAKQVRKSFLTLTRYHVIKRRVWIEKLTDGLAFLSGNVCLHTTGSMPTTDDDRYASPPVFKRVRNLLRFREVCSHRRDAHKVGVKSFELCLKFWTCRRVKLAHGITETLEESSE